MATAKRARKRKKGRLTVFALQKAARIMLPFYRKTIWSKSFADRWAKAVRQADLATMDKLLKSVIGAEPLSSLASNGIGYFIDFPLGKAIYSITNATSIRPGQVQFTFNSSVHRSIARAVYPLYREIARNPQYAALIVQSINKGNKAFLDRLIRSTVKTKRLISLEIAFSGMFLGFKYPASKYVYYNEVFQDYDM